MTSSRFQLHIPACSARGEISWLRGNNATTFPARKAFIFRILRSRWSAEGTDGGESNVSIFRTRFCRPAAVACSLASRSCIEMPPARARPLSDPVRKEPRLQSREGRKMVPRSGTDWELERRGGKESPKL